MGVSTDAILFYGYCWGKEHRLFPSGDGKATDWGEVVARKRGHVSPWDAFPKEDHEKLPYEKRQGAGEAWRKANREALDAWREAKAAVEKEFGVEVGQHCSDGCPMPYVTVEGSMVRAWRGYPVDVTGKRLDADPAWNVLLDRWFAETGAEKPEGQNVPRWWLVSYWG